MTPEDLACVRRARSKMDREYDQPLNVPVIARAAHMSPAHFSRSFKEAYGETPHSYLMTRRIERAKTLLRTTPLSVSEISLAVGCWSLGSFGTRFRELVGMSPTEYRAATPQPPIPGCFTMAWARPSRNGEAGAGDGS